MYFRPRIILFVFSLKMSTRWSDCIFAIVALVPLSNQKPLGFEFCFLCSITGMLGKLWITAEPTLPLKLPSFCVMSASLILQTGNSKLDKQIFCLITVRWVIFLLSCWSLRKPTEVEWKYTEEGEKVRVSVRTGRIIPKPIVERRDGIVPQQWKGETVCVCSHWIFLPVQNTYFTRDFPIPVLFKCSSRS